MKRLDFSLSRLVSGIAALLFISSLLNSCDKPGQYDDNSGVTTSGYRVSIGGGFNPAVINISTGDMVSWTNDDNQVESVTSDEGLFDGILRNNETYSFKFLSAGTYTYHSRMQPGMTGKIVVN